MSDEPKSALEIEHASACPKALVRRQLALLLAHPLFCNSKRYPLLLAYTVEQTLQGNAADLKERTIGIEVFGRSPTYDSNADPVVRVTAGEVRKRLMQYYYDSAHDGELVIELHTGSYVPIFHAQTPAAGVEIPRSRKSVAQPTMPEAPVTLPRSTLRIRRLRIAGLVGLAVAAGFLCGLLYRGSGSKPLSSLDRFWAPITSAPGTATFCMGSPSKTFGPEAIASVEVAGAPDTDTEQSHFGFHYFKLVTMADVTTLTRIAATLDEHHKAFRVLAASDASFAELREGPVILIGAYDNIWTLHITQKLRFGFDSKDGVALIVDRKNPGQTKWVTAWHLPYQKLSKDYAIVARIHDATTGQPVIIAAGIAEEGTEAAGETLFNPLYLNSLLTKLPPNWETMNMEAVIETPVIQGHAGPPVIQAVYVW